MITSPCTSPFLYKYPHPAWMGGQKNTLHWKKVEGVSFVTKWMHWWHFVHHSHSPHSWTYRSANLCTTGDRARNGRCGWVWGGKAWREPKVAGFGASVVTSSLISRHNARSGRCHTRSRSSAGAAPQGALIVSKMIHHLRVRCIRK